MTRDEVINNLRRVGECLDMTYANEQEKEELEAINMGIEALEQEPCEDAISRQDALDCITATGLKKFDYILNARDKIKNLPSVKPQEQKTGKWKRIGHDIYECSICGQDVMTGDICAYKHCHGCGAKMVEPQERNDKE